MTFFLERVRQMIEGEGFERKEKTMFHQLFRWLSNGKIEREKIKRKRDVLLLFDFLENIQQRQFISILYKLYSSL